MTISLNMCIAMREASSAALVFLRVVEWVSDQFFCPTSDFFDFCNPCFFYHTFTNGA